MPSHPYSFVLHSPDVDDLFDLDLIDDEDPFEIDEQAAHLFKHPPLGVEDVFEAWQPTTSSPANREDR